MPVSQSRRWVFTLNNPVAAERQALATLFEDRDNVLYAVTGNEVGENGTPHIQGFVLFGRNKRFNAVRNLLGPRVHIERAIGTSQQAATYCKKDGDYLEYGELPTSQGRRNDLEELTTWATTFEATNNRPPSSPDIAREYPSAYVRYPRLSRCLQLRSQPVRFHEGELRDWQAGLLGDLEAPADDRTIKFFVDQTGGKGKSWFQRYLITKKPDDAQLLSIGKRDDIAHCIDENKKIFLFNVPRGQMELLQYTILEMLKDRVVFSPKYNSRIKMMRSKVHVVVFSNEFPNMEKMSADRYDIYDMN